MPQPLKFTTQDREILKAGGILLDDGDLESPKTPVTAESFTPVYSELHIVVHEVVILAIVYGFYGAILLVIWLATK